MPCRRARPGLVAIIVALDPSVVVAVAFKTKPAPDHMTDAPARAGLTLADSVRPRTDDAAEWRREQDAGEMVRQEEQLLDLEKLCRDEVSNHTKILMLLLEADLASLTIDPGNISGPPDRVVLSCLVCMILKRQSIIP